MLRRTFVLGKSVTFEPAMQPISASLGCRGQLLPSIIPPWFYVPLAQLQRKLFCLSAFVRPLSPPFPPARSDNEGLGRVPLHPPALFFFSPGLCVNKAGDKQGDALKSRF